MLISYPILIPALAGETEEAYLERLIQAHVISNEGRYPISSLTTPSGAEHHWHGGVHLSPGMQPIRAIADGVVAAYRFAAATETYEGLGDFDTSFVLLRHTTRTGEHTDVQFYSLYMHLRNRAALQQNEFQQLPLWMRQGQTGPAVQTPSNIRVWRKDVLGFGGHLYGHDTVHFEVFTTENMLNTFWRDSTAITQGAGSADFFGDAHFVVPAGQAFRARHPRAPSTGPHQVALPGSSQHYTLPLGQLGTNPGPLYISVRLHQGRRIATSYQTNADGTYTQVGAPIVQDNYEYELHRLATALYPDCPSAGFEWLRFGRVLGPDTTTRNENWQLVRYSTTASGYIDLAPNNIAKFSDADFVHWQGWAKRSEGEAANSTDGLCDDATTIALSQAGDPGSQARLRHLVCKHPTEWDTSDLPLRFARHRASGQPLSDPLAWTRFEQHAHRLAFWSSISIDRSVWHFHPLQFILHFRKCGWLTVDELAQTFPRHLFYTASGSPRTAITTNSSTYTISLEQARTRINLYQTSLNKCLLKYIGRDKSRISLFLAQVLLETAQWRNPGGMRRIFHEWYFGQYSSANPATAFYSAFYGRGIMQLTWAGNYRSYGEFRNFATHTGPYIDRLTPTSPRITNLSTHYTANPNDGGTLLQWAPRYDPDTVGETPYDACDSGGYYWVSKIFSQGVSINRVADRPYSVENVGLINRLVNGGGNGYSERQAYSIYITRVLTDSTDTTISVTLSPPQHPVVIANLARPQ